MQRWGNKRANEYWEYKLPKSYPRPTENSTMADLEKFIRAKYEKKYWVRDDYSDYSDYSYSDDEKPAQTLSLSAIRTTVPDSPKSTSSTPAAKPVGGLSGLSKKNSGSTSPMDELFSSLTLRSPDPSKLVNRDSVDEKARTGSISDLYGPKSPQIDVSMDSIIKKRQALQKLNRVSSPRLYSVFSTNKEC